MPFIDRFRQRRFASPPSRQPVNGLRRSFDSQGDAGAQEARRSFIPENYVVAASRWCEAREPVFAPETVVGVRPFYWGGALPPDPAVWSRFFHHYLFVPELCIDRWRDMTVAGAGLMFTADGEVLHGAVPLGGGEELLGGPWNDLPTMESVAGLYSGAFPAVHERLDFGILIARSAPGNYHHVLCDIIPRLFLIEEAVLRPDVLARCPELLDAPILINGDMPEWALSMIEAVGFSRERLRPIPIGRAVDVKQLYVPHVLNNFAYWVSPHLTARYRQLLAWAKAQAPNADYGTKIFSLRAEVTDDRRRIHNLEQLRTDLLSRGYVEVATQSMSWPEQIVAFSEATHIVAAMGSNISNMLFSPPEARVLIVHPEESRYSLNTGMAAAGGQKIGYLWARCFSSPVRGEHVEMYVDAAAFSDAIGVLEGSA